MMSDKKVFAAFLAATLAVAGGSAWAASEATGTPPTQTTAQKDFGKLSADGAKAYQDLTLTRLAIYDGNTDQAKKLVAEADTAFSRSKSDDTVFMKAEHDMMTSQQVAAKSKAMTDHTMTDQTKASATSQPGSADGRPAAENAQPIAWLPVDGAISLDEDYTINPGKTQAVADANKSLAKGDKQGAIDRLKLADVDTNVVLEVVPLKQTLSDVHQAAQMIDAGKYYEGSQMLRNVQMAARYDVADILAKPKTAATAAPHETGAAGH